MSNFFTGDIWKEVNILLNKKRLNYACIAYVTSDLLLLNKGDILVCDASNDSIRFGQTSAKTLKTYIKKGVNIYSNQNLHSKFLYTDKFLAIGSANLSKRSANILIESAVVTTDDVLISQAKAFYLNLLKESRFITAKQIDRLLKIKVVKRSLKPTRKSQVRKLNLGNNYWLLPAAELGIGVWNRIEEQVTKITKSVARKENIDEEDIGFIRWDVKSKFGRLAKPGDQVIIKLNSKPYHLSWIYPPSTILKKETKDGYTYFYHDDRGSERGKISWTKFKAIAKSLHIQNIATVRTKPVSPEVVQKLKCRWKFK